MNESRERLDDAYRATRYVVTGLGAEEAIRVGEELPARLREYCEQHDAESWAFVTAWNPGSELLDEEANHLRQDELAAEVRARGWSYLAGEGRGADGDWPPEASVWIMGIGREEATALAARFGQNALVFGGLTGPAELIWLVKPVEGQAVVATRAANSHSEVAETIGPKPHWWLPIAGGIIVMIGVLSFAVWSHTTRIRVLDLSLDSVTVEARRDAIARLQERARDEPVAYVAAAVQDFIITEGRMPQSLFELNLTEFDVVDEGWVLVSSGGAWRLYDHKYRLLARGN